MQKTKLFISLLTFNSIFSSLFSSSSNYFREEEIVEGHTCEESNNQGDIRYLLSKEEDQAEESEDFFFSSDDSCSGSEKEGYFSNGLSAKHLYSDQLSRQGLSLNPEQLLCKSSSSPEWKEYEEKQILKKGVLTGDIKRLNDGPKNLSDGPVSEITKKDLLARSKEVLTVLKQKENIEEQVRFLKEKTPLNFKPWIETLSDKIVEGHAELKVFKNILERSEPFSLALAVTGKLVESLPGVPIDLGVDSKKLTETKMYKVLASQNEMAKVGVGKQSNYLSRAVFTSARLENAKKVYQALGVSPIKNTHPVCESCRAVNMELIKNCLEKLKRAPTFVEEQIEKELVLMKNYLKKLEKVPALTKEETEKEIEGIRENKARQFDNNSVKGVVSFISAAFKEKKLSLSHLAYIFKRGVSSGLIQELETFWTVLFSSDQNTENREIFKLTLGWLVGEERITKISSSFENIFRPLFLGVESEKLKRRLEKEYALLLSTSLEENFNNLYSLI